MQHAVKSPPLIVTGTNPDPSFNIVIAYEDLETGKCAKKTYDFLVDNLGHDCHFTNQMWKFDVLMLPKLRDIAVEDAANADIIIISCYSGELPEHVKKWIEAWLPISANPLALVALFDRPRVENCGTNAAHQYLAEIAQKGDMEFFAQPLLSGRETIPFRAKTDSAAKALSRVPELGDLSHSRWTLTD